MNCIIGYLVIIGIPNYNTMYTVTEYSVFGKDIVIRSSQNHTIKSKVNPIFIVVYSIAGDGVVAR